MTNYTERENKHLIHGPAAAVEPPTPVSNRSGTRSSFHTSPSIETQDFMMHLSSLVATLVVVAVLHLSPSSASDEKDEGHKIQRPNRAALVQNGDCIINGYLYRNGQVFTLSSSRCIKYRCIHGNYDFYEEACEMFGQCWPKSRDFNHKCRSYRCTVTDIGANYNHYQVSPTGRQMCEDYYGQCHVPGSRFAYNMKGYLQNDCTCRPSGDIISYVCYGRRG